MRVRVRMRVRIRVRERVRVRVWVRVRLRFRALTLAIVTHQADGSRWACASLSPRSQRAEFNVFDGPAGYIEIFHPNLNPYPTPPYPYP